MAFDLQWDHQFCLGCDKQTDGATYCSESCRLADFEKTASTTSSASSSPASSSPSSPWTFSKPTSSNTRFYLSPAYDFANAQPYGSTPMSRRAFPSQHQRAQSSSLTPPARLLSPSSSHSSLCSVQSIASMATTASAESSQLSDRARRELQAYAISFAQVRLQRRRSY